MGPAPPSPQVPDTFPRHVSFQVDEEEMVRVHPQERAWLTGYGDYRHDACARDKLRPQRLDAYVHFSKSEARKHGHAHPYPLRCDVQRGCGGKWECVEVGGACRPAVTLQPRAQQDERSRCVYCQDMFSQRENGRGRCHEAPDPVQTCIRRVSFLWCADSLLYHCMSDPEGEYSDPCSCDTSDERFCLRWGALLGLSLLAPCMCCYAPLRACYRCGVACRCCGGKHKAVG